MIFHPFTVGMILMKYGVSENAVIAGILHDVIEDTSVTTDEMREIFGEEITYLVDGVTKLKRIPTSTKEELQAINNNLSGKYILANSIVLNDTNPNTDGSCSTGGYTTAQECVANNGNWTVSNTMEQWTPIGYDYNNRFSGIFNGNGYDENWGAQIRMGFKILQTDWPGLVNQYLEQRKSK